MRLTKPRIAPLADGELTPEQEEALAPVRAGTMGVLNIFRTLAHAPKALTRWRSPTPGGLAEARTGTATPPPR